MIRIFIFLSLNYFIIAETIDELPSNNTTTTTNTNNSTTTTGVKEETDKKPIVVDAHQTKLNNIRLVLKYADSETLRKNLYQVKNLKPDEQKLYIEELKELLKLSDTLIKLKILELIQTLSWGDLDNEVVVVLNSPIIESSNDIFFAALNAVETRKITAAYSIIHSIVEKNDFTKFNAKIPDSLRFLGSVKDNMGDFLFQKLQDNQTISNYKTAILQYLIAIEYKPQPAVDYFISNVKDENLEIKNRAMYAKAIGILQIESGREVLKEEFNKIENFTSPDKKLEYRLLRLAILNALIRFKDESAEKIVVSLSRDDDPQTRIKSLQELADINLLKYRELIEYKAKYDPNGLVQKIAKGLLEKKASNTQEPELPTKNEKEPVIPAPPKTSIP